MRFLKRDKFKSIGIIAVAAIVAGLCFLCPVKGDTHLGHPVINEVCSDNFSVICDETGSYYDYIELYNPTDTDYDQPLYLSDDKGNPKKYRIEENIPAKGYLIVYLSKDESQLPLHAPFGISRKGEAIFLSDEDGSFSEVLYVPPLPYDTAYCSQSDGESKFFTMEPTPGSSNDGAAQIQTKFDPSPVFSLEDGFYAEGTELEIIATNRYKVFYTTDGSVPDESSDVYSGPIQLFDHTSDANIYAGEIMYPTYTPPSYNVDKANVIRAVAVDRLTGNKSRVVSHVYFCGFDSKSEYDNVPVVSIIADPDDLFGYENGIFALGKEYDNYKEMGGFTDLPEDEVPASFVNSEGETIYRFQHTNSSLGGRGAEREIKFTYFDEDHKLSFSQMTGMRIAGESSRYNFQKSLNIFPRDIYEGNGYFEKTFFHDGENKVRLRRGDSNLWFQEPFIQYAAEDIGILIEHSKEAAVFVNGEYWGVYNLKEQYDEEYFAAYGIKPEKLWLIKNDLPEFGDEEAYESYNYAMDLISYSDASDPEVYSEIEGLVDIDNLIDYFCTLIIFDNQDILPRHNQELFCTKEASGEPYSDGRWRWIAYDLDVTCNSPDSNTFAFYRELGDNMYLPGCLYENDEFREKFVSRMEYLLDNEYSYDNLHKQLSAWDEEYRAQNIKTLMRYFDRDEQEAAAEYQAELDRVDDFFRQRKTYVLQYLYEDLQSCGY